MDAFNIEQAEGSAAGITVVRLTGPLTGNTLAVLQPALRAITSGKVVIDLEAVPHMDSAGLGALLNYLTVQQKAGRKLAVAAPAKRVQMLFELTKVNTVLPIFATVAEAEQS